MLVSRGPARKGLSIALRYEQLKDQGLSLNNTHYDSEALQKLLTGMSQLSLWSRTVESIATL